MRLSTWFLFSLILAACNAALLALSCLFDPGVHCGFRQWLCAYDHDALFILLFALDLIAFSTLTLIARSLQNDERRQD